jgi:hypothetical protein
VIVLVSGATATHARYAATGMFGHLITPRNGNAARRLGLEGLPWAADNDAFHGFHAARFCSMLGKIAIRPGCLFVACPDVVADAHATLAKFDRWEPIIRELGLPVAFVLQDGQCACSVPWERCEAVFVGGSTEFKESPAAAELVNQAKAHGKWAHMGRVNTRRRFRLALNWGVDSIDGTCFSRWPDKFFPTAMRWLRELKPPQGQATMFA